MGAPGLAGLLSFCHKVMGVMDATARLWNGNCSAPKGARELSNIKFWCRS